LKKNQQKNKQRIIDEYVIFSKVEIDLKSSKKATYLSDLNQFKNLSKKNIEIIFDITAFSFTEIITFMQSNKDKNLSFKNYISSSNYLIGSDDSKDRGQIILL
jgi:site-specific recombinase XerD